jgi:hypothetical protein
MWHVWETGEVRTGFWWEDLSVDGIILKWIKKWDGCMGRIDLTQERTGDGLL